jgi:hypothetical protein
MEARPLLPPLVKPFGFSGLGDGGGMDRLWELIALRQDLSGSNKAVK